MSSSFDGASSGQHHSNRVQQCTLFLSATMMAFLAVLVALTAATYSRVINQQVTMTSITTPYTGLGLPGYETFAWNDEVSAAAGQTVTFSTCATCARYNKMIDGFVIPQMKQVYGINVVRSPQAAVDAVTQVTNEVKAGNTAKGGIDLIWINLENFANLYTANLAYGPWAFNVPSIANFNQPDTSVFYDGGLYTAGYEMPYNGAQCAFIYNKNMVSAQADLVNIRTIAGLQTWIMANKGKFTYAAPATDATGKVMISFPRPFRSSSTFLTPFPRRLHPDGRLHGLRLHPPRVLRDERAVHGLPRVADRQHGLIQRPGTENLPVPARHRTVSLLGPGLAGAKEHVPAGQRGRGHVVRAA